MDPREAIAEPTGSEPVLAALARPLAFFAVRLWTLYGPGMTDAELALATVPHKLDFIGYSIAVSGLLTVLLQSSRTASYRRVRTPTCHIDTSVQPRKRPSATRLTVPESPDKARR